MTYLPNKSRENILQIYFFKVREMSKYEEYIMKILLTENIYFEREKSFQDLKKGKYRFDFYIPNLYGTRCVIEVDGEQHFQKINHFQKTKSDFLKQQENDRRKNSYCLANNILLYRIPYWEIKNICTLKDILKDDFLVKSKWHNDNIRRKNV